MVLILCSLFGAAITYVGDAQVPMDCFTPKEFEKNWNKYVENYCWVSQYGKLLLGESEISYRIFTA